MANEVENFQSAVDALKEVAKALHVPFDTSELERSAKALVKAHPAPKSDDDKSGKSDDGPKVEQRTPVGVPKDSVK